MRFVQLLLLPMAVGVTIACQQRASETADVVDTTAPETAQLGENLLPNLRRPAEGVVSGGQPTTEQLAAARDSGFKTVINLRRPEEKGLASEPEIVTGLGMSYVSLPIAGAAGLTGENVEAFAKALETAEHPVIVHCSSGNRIGAMFALKAFWLDGKNAEEALAIGLEAGLTRLRGAVEEILAAEGG